MPVITVTAPALARAEDEVRALGDVAAAVADALGLRPEDVVVSCVHTATGVVGRRAAAPWPLVVLYGRERPLEQLHAAVGAARDAVARAWQRSPDETWVEWAGRGY